MQALRAFGGAAPERYIVVGIVIVGGKALGAEVVDEEGNVYDAFIVVEGGCLVREEFENRSIGGVATCEAFNERDIGSGDAYIAFDPCLVDSFAQLVDTAIQAIDIDDDGTISLVFDVADMLAEQLLYKGILEAGVESTVAAVA